MRHDRSTSRFAHECLTFAGNSSFSTIEATINFEDHFDIDFMNKKSARVIQLYFTEGGIFFIFLIFWYQIWKRNF